MKEININIEGYNVNGICVGCLNYNRKMFYHYEIKECFKLLGNIDVPDGLTIQVCWECMAAIRNVCSFQTKILKSYDVLSDYSKKHTFLNSPDFFTRQAEQRLSVNVQDNIDVTYYKDLKIEIDIDAVKYEDEVKFEEEFDVPKDDSYLESQNILDSIGYATSDDDVQLSKLKKKKDKKIKKRSKKKLKSKECDTESRITKKLKNLPENLVDLYIMTEEEMRQVRNDDIENKDFIKTKHKCNDCIIEFNSEKLMIYHMTGKHIPKTVDCDQCDVCKTYILTKDKLAVHRSLHLTAYRCLECSFKTTLKRLMSVHVLSHDDEASVFKCKMCGLKFTTKSKMSYHRASCEQERPQCDCCGKVFASKITLKSHLNQKIPKEDKPPKEKLFFPCKGCGKVFNSKKSYRAHAVIHEGQTYPCPICGKLFLWKRNLARHTRNHRERAAGALHECRACDKTFSSRDCYNNHMRLSKRHVPQDSYNHECNFCGKKFATKWCMVDHIDWDHLKRIKYQCSVCFKTFKTAKILVAHVNNIHEGKRHQEPESEHLCEICGKSYKTVKRLKGHVWAMHTNRSTTKSFKCKLCSATFTWQTSIYKHMKMMHDNKRSKPPRTLPSKRVEPYSELSRMDYFQHNIATNVTQNLVQPELIVPNV